MLTEQHRMHGDILSWPNQAFYQNQIQPNSRKPSKSSAIAAYTVFQVNTIEDIEMEFVTKFLKLYTEKIDRSKSSIGIICGHPATAHQLQEQILCVKSFLQFGRS